MRTLSYKIVVAAAGVIVAVALGLLLSRTLLIAWLCAFAFFTFAAFGALMLDAMLALGGARLRGLWRPVAAGAARWIVISPIAFLPLAVGMHRVEFWSLPEFAGQTWFLNEPFALVRAIVYFSASIVGARFILSDSGRASTKALTLLVIFIIANLAAIDWIMALTPAWHSSDFGVRWCVNGLSTAAAVAIAWQSRVRSGTSDADIGARIDGANVLFALNLGWIYLMFVDYITAWSGNLPDEAGWYAARIHGVWLDAIIGIVACHIVVGIALLFRASKRSASALRWLAALVIVAQWFESVWTIAPQPGAAVATAFGFAAIATCVLAAAFRFAPRSIRAGGVSA
ncbi:MAG TPA: hypothetical protein VHW73_00615 [Rudaea sp.]|nr:hypothetical protein [Rudaea sp.]